MIKTIAPLVFFVLVSASQGQETKPKPSPQLRQAKVLHTAIHSTLQVVHHEYFHENEGLELPASVLKHVFADLEKEHGVKLRWLAVEGQPMNVEHVAKTDFEKAVVKAFKTGSSELESVEGQTYRYAATITLGNVCLKCHVPDRKNLEPRIAGLVIEFPLEAGLD